MRDGLLHADLAVREKGDRHARVAELSHVRWYCRYHVAFAPKYRKKVIFGSLRKGIGTILRELCQQEGIEL
jgi:putative transposase